MLTTVATRALLFGAPSGLGDGFARLVARDHDLVVLHAIWTGALAEHPWLGADPGSGPVQPLTGWLVQPDDQARAVSASCWQALAETDLRAAAVARSGDLLGPLYMALRSTAEKQGSGAFYTPMHVSELMAAMAPLTEGGTFLEPTCGAGGMAIAAANVMRRGGLDPATVTWHLNDLDPMAVALAGVNALIHGLGDRVVLSVGDALAA